MYSLHFDCFPLSMKYSIPLNKSIQVWFWKKKNHHFSFHPFADVGLPAQQVAPAPLFKRANQIIL